MYWWQWEVGSSKGCHEWIGGDDGRIVVVVVAEAEAVFAVVETEEMGVMKEIGRMVVVAVARSLVPKGSSYSSVTDLERHTGMSSHTDQH